MKNTILTLIQDLKGKAADLLEKEAARVVAYVSALALGGALYVASRLGITLSPETLGLVALIATGIAAEVIRSLVYAIRTTQLIANRAAATGDTDIGEPPKGP